MVKIILIQDYLIDQIQILNKIQVNPFGPKEWESVKVHYRYKNTRFHIEVMQINIAEEIMVTLDGVAQKDKMITLTDDGAEHNVQVATGAMIMN